MEKVWCSHEEGAGPGDSKRQRKIAGDCMAAKGFALDETRLLLHAGRVASFAVRGRSAGRMSIRSPLFRGDGRW